MNLALHNPRLYIVWHCDQLINLIDISTETLAFEKTSSCQKEESWNAINLEINELNKQRENFFKEIKRVEKYLLDRYDENKLKIDQYLEKLNRDEDERSLFLAQRVLFDNSSIIFIPKIADSCDNIVTSGFLLNIEASFTKKELEIIK